MWQGTNVCGTVLHIARCPVSGPHSPNAHSSSHSQRDQMHPLRWPLVTLPRRSSRLCRAGGDDTTSHIRHLTGAMQVDHTGISWHGEAFASSNRTASLQDLLGALYVFVCVAVTLGRSYQNNPHLQGREASISVSPWLPRVRQ